MSGADIHMCEACDSIQHATVGMGSQKLGEINERLEKLLVENARLQLRVAKFEAGKKDAEKTREYFRECMNFSEGELARLREELAGELSDHSIERYGLKIDIDVLQRENRALRTSMDASEENLKHEIAKLEADKKDLQQQLDSLQREFLRN